MVKAGWASRATEHGQCAAFFGFFFIKLGELFQRAPHSCQGITVKDMSIRGIRACIHDIDPAEEVQD